MVGSEETDNIEQPTPEERRTTGRRGFLAACGVAAVSGCTAPLLGARRRSDADTESGTVSLEDDPTWRMSGNGPTNAGFAPTTGPDDEPTLVWDVPVEGIHTVPGPVYRDGTVFVGSGPVAYAVDAASGNRTWTRELDHLAHHYSPAIAEERVLVGSRTQYGARTGGGEGTLYALSIEDGSPDWTLEAPVSSGPVVVEDEVYVTSTGERGVVHALDREGVERWTRRLDAPDDAARGSVFGAPAVAGDSVFVTATAHRSEAPDDGSLFALSRADGSVRWRRDVDAELRPAPLVDASADLGDAGPQGVVYAASSDGGVHAFGMRAGEEAWSADVGSEVLTTPAMDGEAIYLLAAGDVIALDRTDGSRRWRAPIGASRMNGLAVTEDGVYVGGTNVTALDPTDGRLMWGYPVPSAGGAYGAPIVLNGTVFTGACVKRDQSSLYDNFLYALA